MINKNNLKFVKDKFRELNIQLSKQELEYATYQIERHGSALALSRGGYHNDDIGRIVDKDTNEINEHIWNIYFSKTDQIKEHNYIRNNYGSNILEFLKTRQNHLIQNQQEEKYSIGRSNEVSRYLRSLNDLILNRPILQQNTYNNHLIISAIVKKIFKIELNQRDMNFAVKDRNFLKYFFNAESLITSKKLFWIVFNVVYTYSNFNEFNLQDWERVLSRYDRISSDEYYTERCRDIFGDIVAKHSKHFFNETRLNDYFTIYRGFLVKPSRYVRKDKKKLNNSNSYIQEEGRGFSYSLDKEQAIRFACRYHFKTDFDFRKNLPTIFGSMSHNKIFKNLRRDYKKVLGSNYNQNYLDLGTRRCLGTYRVKKKDIISFNVSGSIPDKGT